MYYITFKTEKQTGFEPFEPPMLYFKEQQKQSPRPHLRYSFAQRGQADLLIRSSVLPFPAFTRFFCAVMHWIAHLRSLMEALCFQKVGRRLFSFILTAPR